MKNIGPVTDYCLVGNMQELKNVELVIKTFIQLYNLGSKAQITFYGGTEERLAELKAKYELTPNIKFVGIVEEVPYQIHLQTTQQTHLKVIKTNHIHHLQKIKRKLKKL